MSDNTTTITTKKAAREAGMRPADKWLCWRRNKDGASGRPKIPRRGERPLEIKGEKFFQEDQCEEVISKTEAGHRGLRVPRGVEPVGRLHRSRPKRLHYDVYRLSACKPKQKRSAPPPQEVDLLTAIFTVNKSAKRYRDGSQSHYGNKQHGFAGDKSEKKRALYRLKEVGIAEAVKCGRLLLVGIHGGLALYRGEGYCFHSTIVPRESAAGTTNGDGKPVFVESSPKGAGEARCCDAEFTLDGLPDVDMQFFESLSSPERRVAKDLETSHCDRRFQPLEEDLDDDAEDRLNSNDAVDGWAVCGEGENEFDDEDEFDDDECF